MDNALIISILAATVQTGTPILFATLGELITERSGVLNLGVEGLMIMGAFFAFIVQHTTGNPWLAMLAAGFGVALLSTIHGFICLVFQGNQIVSGLAITILGVGLANYLGTPFIGTTTTGFAPYTVPILGQIPIIGEIFFRHDAMVNLSFLCVPLIWFFLKYTSIGLHLCATGENPQVAYAAGLNPVRLRWLGITLGAFFIGLGGAYLSLAYTHVWTTHLTAGRGWIAIALVIFAFWRPWRTIFGAYLFGGIMALQLRLQALGISLPSSIMMMLPYLLTILVLLYASIRSKRASAPAGLGINIPPQD